MKPVKFNLGDRVVCLKDGKIATGEIISITHNEWFHRSHKKLSEVQIITSTQFRVRLPDKKLPFVEREFRIESDQVFATKQELIDSL